MTAAEWRTSRSPLVPPVALVMAKAPLAGVAKTRLAATAGKAGAARLALAALLDTVEACEQVFGADHCHLAVDGDLARVPGIDLPGRLAGWTLHRQRGEGLGQRIANAHRDVHALTGAPVVQLGMDTPHLTTATLGAVADAVTRTRLPVLGLAEDGGWWVLASGEVHHVDGLERVPMSTELTGLATRNVLRRNAGHVTEAPVLRDVDVAEDAEHAALSAPASRFARAWAERRRA